MEVFQSFQFSSALFMYMKPCNRFYLKSYFKKIKMKKSELEKELSQVTVQNNLLKHTIRKISSILSEGDGTYSPESVKAKEVAESIIGTNFTSNRRLGQVDVTGPFQPLFELMSESHGLTLLYDEMSEIMNVCRDIDKAQKEESLQQSDEAGHISTHTFRDEDSVFNISLYEDGSALTAIQSNNKFMCLTYAFSADQLTELKKALGNEILSHSKEEEVKEVAGIEVGDTVITSLFEETDELNFLDDMKDCLNKAGVVSSKMDEFYVVHGYAWPLYALTLVKKVDGAKNGEILNP